MGLFIVLFILIIAGEIQDKLYERKLKRECEAYRAISIAMINAYANSLGYKDVAIQDDKK